MPKSKLKEDIQTEFKSSFTDAVIESLTAFANSKGGRVLVGVDDGGKLVKGFTIGAETLQKWINEVKNKTQPGIIPDAGTVDVDGARVGELSVKEFPVKPVTFKGRYYKRMNNANHQLSLSEIADMHLRSFNTSWDAYVNPERSIDSLSLDKVNRFVANCNEDRQYPITDDPLTVLNKYELIKGDQVTNAAFLLFAKDDVFQAAIELGRFSTPTSIKDGITVRSDLFSEVSQVLDFIRKHINKSYIITGDPRREERWQYPMDAIREIVINMIVHRQYMDPNDSSIKIYDNYIEFFNPGSLPDNISVEQLLSGNYSSSIRNKKIAATFKEAQFIETVRVANSFIAVKNKKVDEKYGSGIKRIQEGFAGYGLVAPVFENFQNGFRVVVHATAVETVENTVENTVEKILGAMLKNSKITIKGLQKITGLTRRGIEYHLNKLKTEKRIERIGSDRSGHWHVNE